MNVQVQGRAFGTFAEIAETLIRGLSHLEELPNRTIVLGAHLLPDAQGVPFHPDDRLILYNFEQRESPALSRSVVHYFRHHEVWDYSPSNVAWWRERGVSAKHVPIGFIPELQRIEKSKKPDIDVLFYGLVNERRRRLLEGLRAVGLVVHELVDCYGRERDHFIGRSKVVLNAHYYETGIFEMVRCSYLFANKVCVVSEDSVDVPAGLLGALPFASYADLVDICSLVVRQGWSDAWATKSYEAFRLYDETAILREAIRTGG